MGLRQGKTIYEMREGMFYFECPGCKYGHAFYTKNGPISNGVEQLWQFNGDLDKPTISPSLDVCRDDPTRRCHSWVKNGMIEFLTDSHHELKGQTVPIPELED